MLHGSNLPIKFWPYAFHHYVRIKNSLAICGQSQSPLEISSGEQDNFSQFRTFGCRVWVRPPGFRSAKLCPNSRKGIFLGYLTNTTKNIVWYDTKTNRVKVAKHARFDEGMNDLPIKSIPPNVQHLQRVNNGKPIPAETSESSINEFFFTSNPFSTTLSQLIQVQCDSENYGFDIATNELNNRAFFAGAKPHSTGSKLLKKLGKTQRAKIVGSFITKINNTPIFT